MADEKISAEELARTREQVEARVKQEQEARAEAGPEITHDFVVGCLRSAQKGDGILYAALHRGKLVCAPELKGQWYQWMGSYWKQVFAHRAESAVEAVAARYDEARCHCKQLAEKASADGDKEGAKSQEKLADRFYRRVTYLRERAGVTNTLCFSLANDGPLSVELAQFDADPWLLAVKNGVIDLRTGAHRAARPSDMTRRYCPVDWMGIDAPAPVWEKFVPEVVGDDQATADFLARVYGYGATGLSCEPVFLVLAGEGRNGKTVLVETLGKVLGEYMSPISAELLLDQGQARSADAPTPTIMSLRGLRIAYAAETDEHRKFSCSRVKWLSGDDRLTGRYPWDRDPTSFTPSHLLVLLTNHKPHAPAHEYAFWDRLRLVTFPWRYVERPTKPEERLRDPTLPERLAGELPGILAWLVRGCLEYQRQGINPPESVLAATEEYKREEDVLADFAEDVLLDAPGERVAAGDMYDMYVKWFKINRGKKVMTQNSFGKLLAKKIHKERRGGGVYYYNVRLSEEAKKRYDRKDSEGEGSSD